MQEPTDNQLDGLFRKSAEEFNAPFDPAAWQAMKTRLDTHNRLTLWEHLLRWGLPVLLLLLLTGGSWNAHRQRTRVSQPAGLVIARRQPAPATVAALSDNSTQRPQQRTENSQPLLDKATPTTAKPDSPAQTAVIQSDGPERSVLTGIATESVRSVNEAAPPSVIGKRNRPTTAKAANRTTRPHKSATHAGLTQRMSSANSSLAMAPVPTAKRSLRTQLIVDKQRQSRRLPGKTDEDRVGATFSAINYATGSAQSFIERRGALNVTAQRLPNEPGFDTPSLPAAGTATSVIVPSFIELTNQPGQWPEPLFFTDRAVTMPTNPANAEPPVSAPVVTTQRGLSVRFLVSPDLSAIGLRNFQRPGTNVGLLVEYRLASRWSVQAGVLQSTKVYKALPSDYEWPKSWKGRTVPESVSGRCNMLDIPINLRYDVALRPSPNGLAASRWFVSGGVTTYIMKQEKYDYNYPVGTRPSTPTTWSTSTGRYNFSQLNLSTGYERTLSRRLSWQVEPFAKVPLRGVGYFKINLLSMGAFVSLRYKL